MNEPPDVKEQIAKGSRLALKLTMTGGDVLTLDVLGRLATSWNRLMAALVKEVSPDVPLDWRVVSLAIIGDQAELTVEPTAKRKRVRIRKIKP